ncbi:hypothetical protein [Paenibacillus sp. HB172176]|uniref:hypothetical protein n=1 Tax=Paenibacillus sp. HB172176 TaxID=2493690 RepID=UPI001438C13A|nr:hypothetical protein [Paenibacillus sp. HB172176]
MNKNKLMGIGALAFLLLLLFIPQSIIGTMRKTGTDFNTENRIAAAATAKTCPDAEIDYMDAIYWNDRFYDAVDQQEEAMLEEGELLGEINYSLMGHACADYRMKNGDATYLSIGTPVYAAGDYDPSFRLMAKGKIYQSGGSSHEGTIEDEMDIAGRITGISYESSEDGEMISAFDDKAVEDFETEYLSLAYLGRGKLHELGLIKHNRSSQFLRIHLNDGTSYRIVYWAGDNAISPDAIATQELKDIILKQIS